MSNNKSNVVGWAGLVLVILALVAIVLTHAGSSAAGAPNSGGPSFNAGASFPVGLTFGSGVNRSTNMGQIQIARGANQASWLNTTGRTVYVNLGDVEMAGTASSTFKVYVGTTTQASSSVADQFTLSTAPIWSQFIDGGQISTSTVAGAWLDNITNHKTSYPGTLPVLAGQRLFMVANTFCKADGACNTATSTNRGWTTLTLPFYYNVN